MPLTEMDMRFYILMLSNWHQFAHEPDVSPEIFGRCGMAISQLFFKIKEEHGRDAMMQVFVKLKDKLNCTPGPLDLKLIQELMAAGFVVKSVKGGVHYSNKTQKD